MERAYIIKTDYFSKPWTWIKRFFKFLFLVVFLVWINTTESGGAIARYDWIKYTLFGIIGLYIFIKPMDELALDSKNLYYVKKSILKMFCKTTEYRISNMKSIGCGGVYDRDTEFLIKGNSYRNRLEIIFKDSTSKSHDVTIYKSELKEIVNQVLRLLNQKSVSK